jgi:hypothetical protein
VASDVKAFVSVNVLEEDGSSNTLTVKGISGGELLDDGAALEQEGLKDGAEDPMSVGALVRSVLEGPVSDDDVGPDGTLGGIVV